MLIIARDFIFLLNLLEGDDCFMNKIQSLLLNQIHIPNRLLTHYKEYGLNEIELIVLLQIHRNLQNGITFPTPKQLSEPLTIDEKTCTKVLRKLIQSDLLAIEQLENEALQLSEVYSLEPLWNKIIDPPKVKETINKENVPNQIGEIFKMFEQEFGRPISPFEIEMINSWIDLDKIDPSLIQAALRESVLMGKLNFKYIDRILREWKHKGVHTVEKAKEVSQSFRKKTTTSLNKDKKRDTSFYYNWLEGEE